MFERFLRRESVALVLCTVALTAVADSAVSRSSPPRDDAAASWIDSWQLQPMRQGAGVLTHVHDDFIGPPLGPSDFGAGRYRVASLRDATHFIANTVGRPLRYDAAGRIRSDKYLGIETSRSYPLPPKRFAVVFDPVHRVTLSTDDAGDTRSSVLDTTLGKPPHALARADLSRVRTKLGIAIGDSSERVMAIWGEAAVPFRMSGGRSFLICWSPLAAPVSPRRPRRLYTSCGQTLEAILERDHVVAIVITTGC